MHKNNLSSYRGYHYQDVNDSYSIYSPLLHEKQANEFPMEVNKSLSIDENDIVLITPIKAKNLRICRLNCNRCLRSSKALFDLKLYSNLLQIIIFLIVTSILAVNVYTIVAFCNESSQKCVESTCRCQLKMCHLRFLRISLLIINIITSLLFVYDNHQFKNSAYRLNDKLLTFLLWSGGWILGWPLIALFKYAYPNIYFYNLSLKRYGLLVTIFSLTGPFFYFNFLNENYNK
jgi:hypothetical protein